MEIEKAVKGTGQTIKTISYRGQAVERVSFNALDFVRSVIRARRSKAPPRNLGEYLDRYDEERG